MLKNKFSKVFGHSTFTKWNILGYLLIGFVIGSVIVSGWFIYQYLFNTLEEANSIVVLKSTPDIDIIDYNLYDKTKDMIKMKEATSTIYFSKRNIFTVATTSYNFTPTPSVTAPKK